MPRSISTLFRRCNGTISTFHGNTSAFQAVVCNVGTYRYDRRYLHNASIKDHLFALSILLTNLRHRTMTRLTMFIFQPTSSTSQRVTLMLIANNGMNYQQPSVRRQNARPLYNSRSSINSPFSQENRRNRTRCINYGNRFTINHVNFFRRNTVVFRITNNIKVLRCTNRSIQHRFRFVMFSCARLSALQGNTDDRCHRYLQRSNFICGCRINAQFLRITQARNMRRHRNFNYNDHFIRRKTINGKRTNRIACNDLRIR